MCRTILSTLMHFILHHGKKVDKTLTVHVELGKTSLITHSGAHPSTILIDITIAAHNFCAAGHASLPGCAAEACYAAKAASYARDYRPPPLMMCSFSSSQ